MVEKCLSHTKPVIKTKSFECIMVMFEVTENFEAETMDALEELCKSKIAKVTFCNFIFRYNKQR
jgi:hypothetical protein